MSAGKVRVTIYRFAGKQLFFTIPQRFCEECDLTIHLVNQIVAELGEKQVELVVKPWLNYLPEALIQGAWHPPAVFVDGKRVSQGVVPKAGVVRERILAALSTRSRIHDSAEIAADMN